MLVEIIIDKKDTSYSIISLINNIHRIKILVQSIAKLFIYKRFNGTKNTEQNKKVQMFKCLNKKK